MLGQVKASGVPASSDQPPPWRDTCVTRIASAPSPTLEQVPWAKTFGQFGSAGPGGGVGARITLASHNHVNLRVDFAWGNNSRATYVSLGEAL